MIKGKVIFSQRLKILKESKVDIIVNDFFDEILEEMNISISNYKKSNDEKYLTEIKNITGNLLNDDQLKKLALGEKNILSSEMKKIFSDKQKSRINILGEKENNSLEKKVFLQIIDFSWRSHLQYLEQLRQVIGLRQYGQKDPLSEFKKEAFVLFEGLLTKIKNDVIKLLLNLNIVISNKRENKESAPTKLENTDFRKVGRNEKCPCGSGKKYKFCHGNV